MRSRAASMSARVGAVLVANAELPRKDLTDGAQRVEPARLDLVEQRAQLRVARDGALELAPGARGRDGEHLRGEIAPPPLLEQARLFQVRAVSGDRFPELVDPLFAQRLGQQDRRLPWTAGAEAEHLADVAAHRLRERVV